MGEVGLRTVRDGTRLLRFRAAVIGVATSQRGSAPRWSELVVYRLEDGTYLISKIGRSRVAHAPTCLRVNHRMISWDKAQLDSSTEYREPRVPCADCRPRLNPMSPDIRLEVSRYRAILCQTAESAAESLLGDRATLLMPQVVATVLAQCSAADPNFSMYSDALGASKGPLLNSTRTP